MKYKTGTLTGCIIGVTSFLVLFKLMVLPRIPPSDELAPGFVIFMALLNGLLFAFAGRLIQGYFAR